MEQCLYCEHRLFFKPFPNETFTCCFAWGEKVGDIDLGTGLSPAVKLHGLEEKPCEKFKAGSSAFQDYPNDPFYVHSTRREGEKFLFKMLTN